MIKFNVEPISDRLPVTPLTPLLQARIEWIEQMINDRIDLIHDFVWQGD